MNVISVVSVVGHVGRPLGVGAEGRVPARALVDERAGEDLRAERVRAERERRDDTEVAAAAAQAPEQVRVLLGARPDALARREDDVRLDEVVDGQPVSAGEPADAAAEREARDPGPRHHPDRHGQPERLGRAIDVRERRPGPDADQSRIGVDLDRRQAAHVQDDPVVHRAVARDVVAPAADRERQPRFPGERDRRRDVLGAGRLDDEAGTLVDHAVPDAASVIVVGVARGDDPSLDGGAQLRGGL